MTEEEVDDAWCVRWDLLDAEQRTRRWFGLRFRRDRRVWMPLEVFYANVLVPTLAKWSRL